MVELRLVRSRLEAADKVGKYTKQRQLVFLQNAAIMSLVEELSGCSLVVFTFVDDHHSLADISQERSDAKT